jgi:ubiquinone/menaquinone biosynthesis C-methylase UbiE
MSEERQYFAKHAEFHDELERTRLRERDWDPTTIRRLTHLGLSEGWRCLEVGGGGGSIARWLAERVGPTGHVVVVDIDTRFLDKLEVPNIEVRRQDITKTEPEPGTYDLVHCRLLLMHMADPVGVLHRFMRTLKPGGWVLAEECDATTWAAADDCHPLAQTHNATVRKIFEFWRTTGVMDCFIGRSLPALLKKAGLAEIDYEGIARTIGGGYAWAQYMEKSFQRTDEMLLAQGVLTRSEIADRRRSFEDPTFYFRDLLFDASWGRRAA